MLKKSNSALCITCHVYFCRWRQMYTRPTTARWSTTGTAATSRPTSAILATAATPLLGLFLSPLPSQDRDRARPSLNQVRFPEIFWAWTARADSRARLLLTPFMLGMNLWSLSRCHENPLLSDESLAELSRVCKIALLVPFPSPTCGGDLRKSRRE